MAMQRQYQGSSGLSLFDRSATLSVACECLLPSIRSERCNIGSPMGEPGK